MNRKIDEINNVFGLDAGFFSCGVDLIRSDKAFKKYQDAYNFNMPEDYFNGSDALLGSFENDSGGDQYFILCYKSVSLDILIHELSHATDYIMDYHGVPVNMKNTEIRAYLLQHLLVQACKAIGKKL